MWLSGRRASTRVAFPLFLAISLMVPPSFMGSTGPSEAGTSAEAPPSSQVYDARIYIEGDSGFTQKNGVSSGSGTALDPYIIENRTISAYHGTGIAIRNTTKPYIVRNCTVRDGSLNMTVSHTGFMIVNSRNGLIEHCISSKNLFNLEGHSVHSMVIANNTFNGSWYDCIYVDSSSFLTIEGNTIGGGRSNGISLDSCNTSSILNNEVRAVDKGISLVFCERMLIEGNDVSLSDIGIYLLDVSEVRAERNLLHDNCGPWKGAGIYLAGSCFNVNLSYNDLRIDKYGAFLDDGYFYTVVLYRNNFTGCDVTGILVEGHGTRMEGNRIICPSTSDGMGVVLLYTMETKVVRNRIEGGEVGILDTGGYLTELVDNLIENSSIGILLEGTHLSAVLDNELISDGIGLLLKASSEISDNIVVSRNMVSRSSESGIRVLNGCHNHIVRNNTLDSCNVGYDYDNVNGPNSFIGNMVLSSSKAGMRLKNDRSGSIRDNSVIGPACAIEIEKCDRTEISNNLFRSSQVVLGPGNINIFWYRDRFKGTNIVGGPYCMGNYWSDYSGSDIDGDGIGDTQVPHGPGDQGPLILDPSLIPDTTPPWVEDLTSTGPATGEMFASQYIAHDDRLLLDPSASLKKEVMFTGDADWRLLSSSMVPFDEDLELSLFTQIPLDAVKLRIELGLSDFSGNIGRSSFEYDIADTIPPSTLWMTFDRFASTGGKLRMEGEFADNIGMGEVQADVESEGLTSFISVHCPIEWYNWTEPEEYRVVHHFLFEIPVPDDSAHLRMKVRATDTSGLSVWDGPFEVPVNDTIPPRFSLHPGRPVDDGGSNSLTFEVLENIGLERAKLRVQIDEFEPFDVFATDLSGDLLTFTFDVWNHARHLSYFLSGRDTWGNWGYLNGSMEIVDTIMPEILDNTDEDPVTGQPYNLFLSMVDGSHITSSFLNYWYDSRPGNNLTHFTDNIYLGIVPEDALVLHYAVGARDQEGNWNIRAYRREVIDGTPPWTSIEDGVPRTSQEFVFTALSMDNRGPSEVIVRCSFEPGNLTAMPKKVGLGTYSIHIEPEDERLSVHVSATDAAGNNRQTSKTFDVKDGTAPEIVRHSAKRVDGGRTVKFRVTATDNRGILEARVEIIRDGRTVQWVELKELDDGTYEGKRDLSYSSISYRVTVTDIEGNSAVSDEVTVRLAASERTIPLWAIILLASSALMVAIFVGAALAYRRSGTFRRRLGVPEPRDIGVGDGNAMDLIPYPEPFRTAKVKLQKTGPPEQRLAREDEKAAAGQVMQAGPSIVPMIDPSRTTFMEKEERNIMDKYLGR